ncbi:hypothetical protein HDV02_005613 [Globomyces sp. JEL0801]|nr:hypothetical protein HDV02_005613 [Globomyces sp. JEL0801]
MDAIKERNPESYYEIVGQHIPASERTKAFPDSMSLIDRIYSNYNESNYMKHVEEKTNVGGDFVEEFETDEETEDEVHTEKLDSIADINVMVDGNTDPPIERELELIRIMKEMFLAGKDDEFDYAQIDMNEQLDDIQQLDRDLEDAYFDDD